MFGDLVLLTRGRRFPHVLQNNKPLNAIFIGVGLLVLHSFIQGLLRIYLGNRVRARMITHECFVKHCPSLDVQVESV